MVRLNLNYDKSVEDEAKKKWNSQADQNNQWDTLDLEEKKQLCEKIIADKNTGKIPAPMETK